MKICFVCHSFPPIIGGGESHVATMAKYISDLGHDVTVITGTLPNPFLTRDRPKEAYKIIEVEGFREYCFGEVNFRSFIPRLYDAVKLVNAEIIHVHNFMPLMAISFFRSVLKSKICFTYHSTPVPEEGKIIGLFKNMDLELGFSSFIFSQLNYDLIINPSLYYQYWSLKLGAPPGKTIVVKHGVDLQKFKVRRDRLLRKSLGYSEKDILVCSPIRLIRRKGIIDLIKALSLINNPLVKLVVPTSLQVANNSFRVEVETMVKDLHLSQRIKFLYDQISFDRMPKMYAASDLVVLPSHVEGFGLVVLEAMACGRPVVATRNEGTSETVRNFKNGILVSPQNPVGLANAIRSVISDKALSSKLIEGGLKTVKNKFNCLNQAKGLIKAYEGVIMEKN